MQVMSYLADIRHIALRQSIGIMREIYHCKLENLLLGILTNCQLIRSLKINRVYGSSESAAFYRNIISHWLNPEELVKTRVSHQLHLVHLLRSL